MIFRRILAAMLAMVFLLGTASAREETGITAESAREIAAALLIAAAGTRMETEEETRKGLDEAQLAARNAENALYRAMTRPWLMESLCPGSSLALQDANETVESVLLPQWNMEDGFHAMQQNEYGRAYLKLLEEMGGSDMESCLRISREACAVWMAEINHEALAEMNADYACWLYLADTKIDYPVVQGPDNSRYLRRMFNGGRNAAGTLFIDYRNLPDFQDPNTLVYGHHMRNDSMFGSLTDYASQACYEARPCALVLQAGKISLLEFFAGYTTTDGDDCYDIAISDEDDLRAFVELAQQKSDFSAEIEIHPGEHLVTLSTCAYAFKNARYILIGRLVPLEEKLRTEEDTASSQILLPDGEP